MKIAEIHSEWLEIGVNGRDDVEELIRCCDLKLCLTVYEDAKIGKITSENYKDLWRLIYCLSCRDDWAIC